MGPLTARATRRLAAVVGPRVDGAIDWAVVRLDPLGDASAALEGISFLDSFTPSLMPRTSQHQGLAAGLHVLGARLVGGRLDAMQTMVLGVRASAPATLAGRAVTFAAGQAASMIPAEEGETLWRTGVRASGEIVRAAAFSGALYDGARLLRGRTNSRSRPLISAAMFAGGGLVWAGRRLRHRRAVIPRWPIEQKATVPESTAVATVVAVAGTGIGKTYLLTRRGWERYFGRGWGRTTFARGVNAAVWAGAATAA